MKILLVEDDQNKAQRILAFLDRLYGEVPYEHRLSYQSGVEAIRNGDADIVLLDMTLPTFDVTESESGGSVRALGGKDLLFHVQLRQIPCQVVVVTQYDVFDLGEDSVSQDQLHELLRNEFPRYYRGMVRYHPAAQEWEQQLDAFLRSLIREM